jgi:1-acyl-sn-glycerol-3-phosphate acyltransferase
MSQKPRAPHLRSLPGGLQNQAKDPVKASALTDSPLKDAIDSIERRLEVALKKANEEATKTQLDAARVQLNKEVQATLARVEERVRKEILALQKGKDGDLADEINRLLGALDGELLSERGKERLRRLRDKLAGGDVDPYGFDPVLAARLRPLIAFFFSRWFRTRVHGLEHVPRSGRVLFVCNHAGTLPWDGIMLSHALRERREVRALVEDLVFHFPFLGVLVNRLGHVRACSENAERMLQEDRAVAVFPEGVKGAQKLYRSRYRLQRFARGGFVKLALRTNTKIVPVAIVGAEETYPLLARITWLVKDLGLPAIPVTPLFPWLGALGLLPLPAKWSITVGEPIDLSKYVGKAEDRIVVNRLTDRVRTAVQALLDDAVKARGNPWF